MTVTHRLELVWGKRIGNLDNCAVASRFFFAFYSWAEVCLPGNKMTQRGPCSRNASTEASSRILTKWMNPAAVSHVLINMESRFTSLMELLCKTQAKSPGYRRRLTWGCLPEEQSLFSAHSHAQAPRATIREGSERRHK